MTIPNFSGHAGKRFGTLEYLDALIDLYGFVRDVEIVKLIMGITDYWEVGKINPAEIELPAPLEPKETDKSTGFIKIKFRQVLLPGKLFRAVLLI